MVLISTPTHSHRLHIQIWPFTCSFLCVRITHSFAIFKLKTYSRFKFIDVLFHNTNNSFCVNSNICTSERQWMNVSLSFLKLLSNSTHQVQADEMICFSIRMWMTQFLRDFSFSLLIVKSKSCMFEKINIKIIEPPYTDYS